MLDFNGEYAYFFFFFFCIPGNPFMLFGVELTWL